MPHKMIADMITCDPWKEDHPIKIECHGCMARCQLSLPERSNRAPSICIYPKDRNGLNAKPIWKLVKEPVVKEGVPE